MTENVEIKQPKTPKEKVILGLKIGGNVLFYLVIIFLFLFSIMNINAGSKNGGFPNIFGKGFLAVQSDSMAEYTDNLPASYEEYKIQQFNKGDLLYVDVVNSGNINNLKLGDVITYYDKDIEALNTHRIVTIFYDENNKVDSIVTQGDGNASKKGKFYNGHIDTEEQNAINFELSQTPGEIDVFAGESLKNIKGKVTGVKKGAGKVLDNIQQNWLFYFVIPVLALLLFEVVMVIKNFMDLKNEKAKLALANDKDQIEAEIRQQMTQELRAQMEAEIRAQMLAEQNNPVEESTESKEEENPTEE